MPIYDYPNLFHARTKIQFSLFRGSSVRLVIYNLLGELVTELVATDFGHGTYSITWDTSQYPVGVCFCQVRLETNITTIKMFNLE